MDGTPRKERGSEPIDRKRSTRRVPGEKEPQTTHRTGGGRGGLWGEPSNGPSRGGRNGSTNRHVARAGKRTPPSDPAPWPSHEHGNKGV